MQALFLGLDSAGKTSIKIFLETLDEEKASKTRISNGVEVYSVGKLNIKVFPGQASLRMNRKLLEPLLRSSSKLVYVVDAADKKRLGESKRYWIFIRELIENLSRKPEIIFIAHKRDISDSLSIDKVKSFFGEAVFGGLDIRFGETSIYDRSSMIKLLGMIHGTHKTNLNKALEEIRTNIDAKATFIYDHHLLPIAVAIKGDLNKGLLERINDTIISIEKIGQMKATVIFFDDDTNLILIGKRLPEERVIVGAYNVGSDIRDAVSNLQRLYRHYRDEIRNRLWTSW